MSGETSGFLKIPWKIAPETAREAPTKKAAVMRGSRIWKKTVSIVCGHVFSSGKTAESSILQSVSTGMP